MSEEPVSFDEEDLGWLIGIKSVMANFTEDDFNNAGYTFTYKSVKQLLKYINKLESVIFDQVDIDTPDTN